MIAHAHPEGDVRAQIVEATMRLAAARPFGEIAIRDIAAEAGVTLMQFRDAFASKGAVLAALSRKFDRETLGVDYGFRADDGPKDRLTAVLSRRIEAMGPYRAGLKGVRDWLRSDWSAALEINRLTLNALRFCCEAADIETGGALANVKLQGLTLAWGRIVDAWLDDDEPAQTRTLAALNAELSRGERAIAGIDNVGRFVGPIFAKVGEALRRKAPADMRSEDDLATPL